MLTAAKKALTLILLCGAVSGCDHPKTHRDSDEARYDWGQYTFTIDKAGAQVSANLARLVRGGQRTLLVDLKLNAKGECRRFKVVVDQKAPHFEDRNKVSWTAILPGTVFQSCQLESGKGLTLSSTDFQAVLRGSHPDLIAYGDYILTEQEMNSTSEIPVAANIGSRSILVLNTEANHSVFHPVAALLNVEQQGFYGLAIRTEWLDDQKSDESFPKDMRPALYLHAVQVDATDAEFKSQRCRLEFNYARPLTVREGIGGPELLRQAALTLKTPTKECP